MFEAQNKKKGPILKGVNCKFYNLIKSPTLRALIANTWKVNYPKKNVLGFYSFILLDFF